MAGCDRGADRQAVQPQGSLTGHPFEVALHEGLPIAGVVLADQVRAVDWKARRVEVAAAAPSDVVAEALGKLATLLA